MKALVLLTCLAAQGALPAGTGANTKNAPGVRLLPGAGVKNMSQLETAISRSWRMAWKDSFTVRRQDQPGKWVKVRSCKEFEKLDVKKAKTRPDDAWDFLVARAGWCRVLVTIQRASPAKQTFLESVLSSKNPATAIPGSVLDVVNAGKSTEKDPEVAAREQAHASISWAQLDPKLKPADTQPKDRLEFESKDYVAAVTYYAAGDFNGDGIEDVLLQVSLRPFDASQGAAAFFILTRNKPQGLLTVVRTFR